MDIEYRRPQSEQQYIILLGKKYPLIQCNCIADSTISIANSSNTEISNISDFSNANSSVEAMSDENLSSSSGHIATSNDDNSVMSGQAIQPSCGQPANETSVDNKSCNLEEQLESAQENVVSTEPLNDIIDDGSVDDAVALALSLNQETEPSSFQYEVNPDENSSETVLVANSLMEQTQSSAESIADTSETNPPPDYVEEATPVSSSGTNADASQLAVGSTIVSSAENPAAEIPSSMEVSDLSSSDSGPTFSVSSKHNILDYAQSEWKGTTFKAKCLRNGYQMLITNTGSNFMRQIRGDNYCALRATIFQVLSQNTDILTSHPDWKQYLNTLVTRLLNDYKCDWLSKWSFADRLHSTPENRFSVMQDCLNFLIEQKDLSNAMKSNSDRIAHFTALFNSGTNAEIMLFEAIKLLMLETAVVLHHLQARGEEVPIFAWLLFARDTSETPESLMINHLNPAGKTGGLEQVESNCVW